MWHQGKKHTNTNSEISLGWLQNEFRTRRGSRLAGPLLLLERHASGEKQSGAPRRASVGSGSVLLVGHLLHPIDGLAIELFLDGKVGHRSEERRVGKEGRCRLSSY